MTVTINPVSGDWNIISGNTLWSWIAYKTTAGPNNTIVEEKVGEGSFIPEFQNNVTLNKKSFFITATDIIGEVSLNFPNNNDVYNYKINNKISLLAEPVDRNIKFNVTNNPNDIIKDVSQTFSFRVIPN